MQPAEAESRIKFSLLINYYEIEKKFILPGLTEHKGPLAIKLSWQEQMPDKHMENRVAHLTSSLHFSPRLTAEKK